MEAAAEPQNAVVGNDGIARLNALHHECREDHPGLDDGETGAAQSRVGDRQRDRRGASRRVAQRIDQRPDEQRRDHRQRRGDEGHAEDDQQRSLQPPAASRPEIARQRLQRQRVRAQLRHRPSRRKGQLFIDLGGAAADLNETHLAPV
jgi:hypothetical protein